MHKVLMLHRVLPAKYISEPNAYKTFGTLISQEYFIKILSLLTDNEFDFVSISELAARSKSDRLVALTFDDGYSDNFYFAYPSLKKFKATATFYPVINPCKYRTVLPLDIYYQCVDSMSLRETERLEYIFGQTKKAFYWTDPERQMSLLSEIFKEIPEIKSVDYMNEVQLRELSADGFEIGSHGITHSLLTAGYMNDSKILNELLYSKSWLEKVTGNTVNSFSFPAGRYNAKLIELAKKVGYTSTCLVNRDIAEKEILPSYERIFVKPDSLDELKTALEIE